MPDDTTRRTGHGRAARLLIVRECESTRSGGSRHKSVIGNALGKV